MDDQTEENRHTHDIPDAPSDSVTPDTEVDQPTGFDQGDTEGSPHLAISASPRGSRVDVLSGPLEQTVILLALPVLMEQFLNFCVGTYDIWLSGHLDENISKSATQAVGVAAYIGWLASLLFSMVAVGTTALVSRLWGARDFDEANLISNRSLALSAVAGVMFLLFIWPTAPLFAQALGLDAQTAAITVNYLRLDSIGLVFASVSLVGSAALRGTGDMRTPMIVLGMVNILNIIVSTVLVYGWGPVAAMGVDGIVVGTVVARLSGGLLMIAAFCTKWTAIDLHLHQLKVTGKAVRRILKIGLPAAADSSLFWMGHFVFLLIIRKIGDTEFAAHMVGIRVEAITYLPAIAFGAAASTMVGQSLGAGNKERARRAGHHAVAQCCLVGIVITALFYFKADAIYELMHNDPDVVRTGVPPFRLMALFQVPLVIGIIYVAALRGAGDTKFPLIMTAVSTFGLRVPLAWLFGIYYGWGLWGAWLGMCCDMLVRGIMSMARFVWGNWAATKV